MTPAFRQARSDGREPPLWDPDWSTPVTARRLTLVALATATVLVVLRRRRTA